MRCHICDKALSDTEVSWNKDIQSYEPCSTCLEIALDAAYSGEFVADEEVEHEIEDEFGNGSLPILDVETYASSLHSSDYVEPEGRYDE